MMILCRLGSLNSIEQLRSSRPLCQFLGESMPSADSVGRIFDLIDPDSVRKAIGDIFNRLKRNKVFRAPWHGLVVLVIDGHESHATYRRHCDGCLERKIKHGDGERIQYYHRNVTAQLVFEGIRFLLDAESQLLGEGELACSKRLLDRVIRRYSRAFDVVAMDALYAKSTIFKKILGHKKHAIAVLKDDRSFTMRVANSVIAEEPATCSFERNGTKIHCWDFSRDWLPIGRPARIVMTQEVQPPIQRQVNGKQDEQTPPSFWCWITTLPANYVSTKAVVEIGHSRWCIENEGFNELANHWHANHVYRHAATAILNFWLMSMLAYNVFRAFFQRNLRAAVRKGKTMLYFARMISSELYAGLMPHGVPP
jgi:hypothetical protein